MPRTESLSFRKAAESQFNDDAILCFLTITHGLLIEPVRVVWDAKDFVYGGLTFTGFPFDITILSDDENPPTAKLSIQNVSPRIADNLRGLKTPLRIKIELLSSADFDLTVDPRTAIPSPEPEQVYLADKCFLINVQADILQLSGDIVGWNYLQRVWPGIRATQARFPGLFR